MKWLTKLNLVILILLSFSTALVKIFRVPEEVRLFTRVGWDQTSIICFGIIQLVGALLLLFAFTRKWGVLLMILTFSIATVVLFLNHMSLFGLFSLSFIAMGVAAYKSTSNYFIKAKL